MFDFIGNLLYNHCVLDVAIATLAFQQVIVNQLIQHRTT
jgi:hypothetical protein